MRKCPFSHLRSWPCPCQLAVANGGRGGSSWAPQLPPRLTGPTGPLRLMLPPASLAPACFSSLWFCGGKGLGSWGHAQNWESGCGARDRHALLTSGHQARPRIPLQEAGAHPSPLPSREHMKGSKAGMDPWAPPQIMLLSLQWLLFVLQQALVRRRAPSYLRPGAPGEGSAPCVQYLRSSGGCRLEERVPSDRDDQEQDKGQSQLPMARLASRACREHRVAAGKERLKGRDCSSFARAVQKLLSPCCIAEGGRGVKVPLGRSGSWQGNGRGLGTRQELLVSATQLCRLGER